MTAKNYKCPNARSQTKYTSLPSTELIEKNLVPILIHAYSEEIAHFNKLSSATILHLLNNQHNFLHCLNSMQKDNQKQKKDEKKKDHESNCQCTECQQRFGGLPLLLQVIESRSETTTSPDINKPSTSYEITEKKVKEMHCPHCNKIFSHRGDLNKHIRKHTGEKPFKCTICDKNFAHTSNLTRHIRVHTGDKPFECDICHKKFGRKDKLWSHQKSKLCKNSSSE